MELSPYAALTSMLEMCVSQNSHFEGEKEMVIFHALLTKLKRSPKDSSRKCASRGILTSFRAQRIVSPRGRPSQRAASMRAPASSHTEHPTSLSSRTPLASVMCIPHFVDKTCTKLLSSESDCTNMWELVGGFAKVASHRRSRAATELIRRIFVFHTL